MTSGTSHGLIDPSLRTTLESNYYTKSAIDQTNEQIALSVASTYTTKVVAKALNLGEFYSHDFADVYDATDNPDAWWAETPTLTTALGDGWAHVVMDNSANGSTMYAFVHPMAGVIPVVEGTLLIEVKNMVISTSNVNSLWYNAGSTSGSAIPEMCNKTGTKAVGANGTYYHKMTPTGNSNPTRWARSWFGLLAGYYAEFDVRLSYYEGDYDGPYKPYIDQTLSSRVKAAEASIVVNANQISSTVSDMNHALIDNYVSHLTGGGVDTADDAYEGPIVSAKVDGLSVQDSTPTPSAPVAIKSVEAAGAVVAGKNLFNHGDAVSSSNTTKTWTDTGFSIKTTSDGTYRGLLFDRTNAVLKPGITYTISADATIVSGKAKIATRKVSNAQVVSSTSTISDSGHLSLTFTQSASEPMYITFFCTYSTSEAGDVTYNNVQVEIAASENAYELPSVTMTDLLPSTTAPLRSLPDGTCDELTVDRGGTVTVTRRVGEYTIPASAWSQVSDGRYRTTSNAYPVPENVIDNIVSSAYQSTAVTSASQPANTIRTTVDGTRLYLGVDSITVESTVLYPLATPTTETLPSVTMPTVPSSNLTAWVDATDGDGNHLAADWDIGYHTADYEGTAQSEVDKRLS